MKVTDWIWCWGQECVELYFRSPYAFRTHTDAFSRVIWLISCNKKMEVLWNWSRTSSKKRTHAMPLMSRNFQWLYRWRDRATIPLCCICFIWRWLCQSLHDILQPHRALWFSASLVRVGRVAESNDMNLTPLECVQITLKSGHRVG